MSPALRIRLMRRCCRSALAGLMAILCALPFSSGVHAEDNIRMGFYQGARREMSRTDLRSAFSLWSQELATNFKVPVVVTFYEDTETLRQAFERGEINAVSADAMTLAKNFRINELGEGYSVFMPGGWNMLLLAGRESGIQTVADLPGKRIAVLEDDQAGLTYLETVCLRHHGRDCDKVFAEIQRLPTNNQAVMRLFFGKADAVLVYRYGFELSRDMNPQLSQRIGPVVAEVPFAGMFYAFFSSRVDAALRERAVQLIPTLHTYPRGRQLLDIFKMDHLEVASPQELKPFIQMEQSLRDLRNQRERKAKRK